MFNFLKKKKEAPSVSRGFSFIGIDIHNHLIPGIDDGAADAETSIELMTGMMELGFEKFICTPHTYQEIYPNTPKTITAAKDVLHKALAENNITNPLTASSEYLADADLITKIKQKQILPLADNYLLIEFPFAMEPLDAESLIFSICVNNYKPILAHPERYSYYVKDIAKLKRFKEMGCILQMNLLSPTGYYGKDVMEFTNVLLKQKMYDLTGTDLHHERHLRNLGKLSRDEKLMLTLENYGFKNKEIFYNLL